MIAYLARFLSKILNIVILFIHGWGNFFTEIILTIYENPHAIAKSISQMISVNIPISTQWNYRQFQEPTLSGL